MYLSLVYFYAMVKKVPLSQREDEEDFQPPKSTFDVSRLSKVKSSTDPDQRIFNCSL